MSLQHLRSFEDAPPLEEPQILGRASTASALDCVWQQPECSGTPPSPRCSHSVDLMPTSEQLLLFGGDAGDASGPGHAFLLDPRTFEWTRLHSQGDAPRGTVGHGTAVQDTRIYFFGGFDPVGGAKALDQAYPNVLCALECSSVPPRWTVVPCDTEEGQNSFVPPPRRDHTLSAVRTAALTRESSAAMLTPRTSAATRTSAGPLLIFGGWDLLACRNDLHRWVSTKRATAWMAHPPAAGAPPPPCARRGHSATVDGGSLVVFGGCYGLCAYLDDLHTLDIKAMRWDRPTADGAPPGARAWHSATQLRAGVLCLFGGATRDGAGGMACLNDLYLLDTGLMRWEGLEPSGVPPAPRCAHAAAVANQQLFIIGGRGDDPEQRYNDVHVLEAEWQHGGPHRSGHW